MSPLFDQRRRRLITRAEEILQEINLLLAMPESSRDEELSDNNLKVAKSHVLELRDRLQSGKLPSKPDRYVVMTRIIVDQWPLKTRLGDEISELEATYQSL